SETINVLGSTQRGTYVLMTFGNESGAGSFAIGSHPLDGNDYTLVMTGTSEELIVSQATHNLLWDNTGPHSSIGLVTDGPGTWSNGSQLFFDTVNNVAGTWDNLANESATFGASPSGNGGLVTLGTNITVA